MEEEKYHNITQLNVSSDNNSYIDISEIPENISELEPVRIIEKKPDGVCYLYMPIHISADSTFFFDGKDCRELRLYEDAYIRIAGSAYFNNIIVRSADRETNQPIEITRETYNKVRPHIYTDSAEYVRMINSEFSHLGSYTGDEGSTWGISFWHLKSGFINNSKFHDNYFGIYTWETKNVAILNSEFYDNLEYGMDFHDYSDNFLIKNNTVYNNGNHGIIFSKYCNNNRIINNYVYDHTGNAFVKGETLTYGIHGIMLHEQSNNNLISGNILENNDRGIYLYQSRNNIIENNIIINDIQDGIYLSNSSKNIIKNNIALDTSSYGLYSYYSDMNEFTDNYFEKGVFFKDHVEGEERTFQSSTNFVPKTKYIPQDKNPTTDSVNLKSRVSLIGEYVKSKQYHFFAIAAAAVSIIIIEIIYKRFRK